MDILIVNYCPVLFVCTVSSFSETETFWIFPEHCRFLYTLKPCIPVHLLRKLMWSGVGCAPTIFVQFFCFLLHSSVPVLGFTYRKALEQLQNTWLCNMCNHAFIYMINHEKYIFVLSTEIGPGYLMSTFSIIHNFCSRLSIYVKQSVNKTLISCYYSAVKFCFKTFIYNPKFCVQRL